MIADVRYQILRQCIFMVTVLLPRRRESTKIWIFLHDELNEQSLNFLVQRSERTNFTDKSFLILLTCLPAGTVCGNNFSFHNQLPTKFIDFYSGFSAKFQCAIVLNVSCRKIKNNWNIIFFSNIINNF